MKKLAIVTLLVAASCSRQANVGSTPASPEAGAIGAPGPREAVQTFLATAKSQDLQAMAGIWGSSKGPARTNMDKDQLEPRLIYMMRCLRHDSYSILSEQPAADGERIYSVEVRRGTLTPKANFTSTPGPQSRWYLRFVDLEPLNSICVSK